jgi:hypothetical protein
MKRQAQNVPPFPVLHGPRITELHDGRKLFIGTEFERGALVQEDLFVWPPMERRGDFVAANLQAGSYLEREHNGEGLRLALRTPPPALRPTY